LHELMWGQVCVGGKKGEKGTFQWEGEGVIDKKEEKEGG